MSLGESRVSCETQRFLQENAAVLREIARVYVVRMGLAYGDDSTALAEEVFHDAALEALAHPDRLATARQPRAWFMGVMANIVKRRRAGIARRERFEVVISDLRCPPDITSEEDLLDYLMRHENPGPEETVEAQAQLDEIFALISIDDANILRLALIHELQAEKLGQLLNVTPSTARVRVHRALSRLRLALAHQGENRKREKRYE